VCIYRDTAYTSLNDGQTGHIIRKKKRRENKNGTTLSLSLSFNDRTTITLNRTIETERKKE